MNPPPIATASAIVALLALTGSCRSVDSDAPELERLPYHVALVPPDRATFRDETPTQVEDGEETARLELIEYAFPEDGDGAVDVSEVFRTALEEALFTRVTRLSPPADGAPVREGWWESRAKLAGADLLLEIDRVVYDSRPATQGRPWNYFWFLTGPLVYAFPDRDYRLQGTLEASLYDIQGLPEVEDPGAADLSAYALDRPLRSFRAKPDWVATKFGDRVDGTSSYVTSLILPTNMLAHDSLEVRQKVTTMSLDSMARALAEEISVDAEYVEQPDWRQAFHLGDSTAMSLADDGDTIVLEATVWQNEDSRALEFRSAEVRVGDDVVIPLDPESVMVTEVSERGGWEKRRLQVSIPVELTVPLEAAMDLTGPPPVARTVQLVLTDKLGGGQTRSWTFGLSAEDHARAVGVIEARLARGEDIGVVGGAFRVQRGAVEPTAPVEVPVDEVPVDEVPVDEVPVDEAPVDEAPVDEAPVDEAPVEEAPVEEAAAEEAPAEALPTDEEAR